MAAGNLKPILLGAGFLAVAAAGVFLLLESKEMGSPDPEEDQPEKPDKPDKPDKTAEKSAEPKFDVGEVIRGEVVKHVFVIPNDKAEELVIERVSTGGTVKVERHDSKIAPSEQGEIEVSLDTSQMRGAFREALTVTFASKRNTLALELRGRVIAGLSWEPKNHIYFIGARSDVEPKSIELVNHKSEPLELSDATSSETFFKPKLEEVEKGKRYRLTVTLADEMPPGKHTGKVEILDVSGEVLTRVQIRVALDAAVDASPSPTNFGTVRLSDVEHQALGQKTVLITKHKGTDFEVLSARSDLAYLEVSVEPHEAGKSFKVQVKIVKDKAAVGEISGTLFVKTNDPEFAELEVPILGTLL